MELHITQSVSIYKLFCFIMAIRDARYTRIPNQHVSAPPFPSNKQHATYFLRILSNPQNNGAATRSQPVTFIIQSKPSFLPQHDQPVLANTCNAIVDVRLCRLQMNNVFDNQNTL